MNTKADKTHCTEDEVLIKDGLTNLVLQPAPVTLASPEADMN